MPGYWLQALAGGQALEPLAYIGATMAKKKEKKKKAARKKSSAPGPGRNKHGLPRNIPSGVRKTVRARSKFACVQCRSGFYHYEHIDPLFEDATKHDPDCICCLCASCHDGVTRGRWSKDAIKAAYKSISEASPDKVGPPVGPLDFTDGNAQLLIGRLLYSPAVCRVFRYHGEDVIAVHPSKRAGEPGRMSATFTDDNGNPTLWLRENEWIGSLDAWDIDTPGQRIIVRRKERHVVLQLRLDPPGRIVVERLDMRFKDAHVLATEHTWAAGRCYPEGVHWVHAYLEVVKSTPYGAAIEFTQPATLEQRLMAANKIKPGSAGPIAISAIAGLLVIPTGIAVASQCGAFNVIELVVGPRPLADMRKVVFGYPEQVARFIGTGKLAD
jgi:hypothetical protein